MEHINLEKQKLSPQEQEKRDEILGRSGRGIAYHNETLTFPNKKVTANKLLHILEIKDGNGKRRSKKTFSQYTGKSIFAYIHQIHGSESNLEDVAVVANMRHTIYDAATAVVESNSSEFLDKETLLCRFDNFVGLRCGTSSYLAQGTTCKHIDFAGEKNFKKLCDFLEVNQNSENFDVVAWWRRFYFDDEL